jgi:phosphatidylglycerol lysyltransferase
VKRLSAAQIPSLVAVVAVVLAGFALRDSLSQIRYHQVEAYIASIPWSTVALALGLSFLSVLASSSLDLVAVRYLGRKVRLGPALVSSFVATSVSNTTSPALLTGGALRFRLYSALGMSAEDIGLLVLFGAIGFWLGFAALAGVVFLFSHTPLPPSLGVPRVSLQVLGGALLASVAIYVVACARRARSLQWGRWKLTLPSLGVAAAQVLISAGDWLLAAAALWVLAPDLRRVPFPAFLVVYLGAQAAGLVSHVPAGLGVFEAVVVRVLAPHAPASDVLGALAAYRIVYYLAPLGVSLVTLGAIEVRRAKFLRGLRDEADRWLGPWVPSLLATSTFIAGFVLLVSGATPGLHPRMQFLEGFVPLAVIETSHFLGSVVGAALLLSAYGLLQRLDGAYLASVAFLVTGILFSLLKGLDVEEASLLLAVLLALLPARRHFYRRASVLQARFSLAWNAAVVLALAASIAVGLFAFRHVEYDEELWWRFTLFGHAPRFLRATVGASCVALVGIVAWMLRPAVRRPRRASPDELAAAEAIVKTRPETYGHLALLGDKSLVFNADRTAFVMYGVQGRSWVALGDPVGPESQRVEMCWRFRELADREGGRTAFYDVPPASLPIYVEMGLTLLKLGDEARVPLERFTLEGKDWKEFRNLLNQGERMGITFEVAPPSEVPAVMPELRAVSDDWLSRKKTREKGFSMGYFDEPYIARCHVAIVRRHGELVAFGNLWSGAPGGELSVDLMRARESAPPRVIDTLFLRLMLWGRERGYRWFNLGMAPLSGLTDHALAPVWNRVGMLLYRHGEAFYNFRGLRFYKEKFDPVWQSRYLACTGGLGVAGLLIDIAGLNSRGLGGVVSR